MVRIAQALPETRASLAAVRGMSPYILERFGSGLLAAVERGRAAAPLIRAARADTRAPERKRLSDIEWRTFEALRAWRKTRSEKDGVDPVVIMTTESLRRLAVHACGGDPLGPLSDLKRDRYGADILKVVAAVRAGRTGSPPG